jgi:hypothetical protein
MWLDMTWRRAGLLIILCQGVFKLARVKFCGYRVNDLCNSVAVSLCAAMPSRSVERRGLTVCRMPHAPHADHICKLIYGAFALTLWTVPVWTPDQLILAIICTTHCLLAPIREEQRFTATYGECFAAYQKRVGYVLPQRNWRYST